MELTLLTKEQLFGPEQLEVFKKRGVKAEVTDNYILSGGFLSNNHEEKIGCYWTKTAYMKDSFNIVNSNGNSDYQYVYFNNVGIRPVLSFSVVKESNELVMKRAEDGILEVEYGYYLEKATDRRLQERLEKDYFNNRILKTGNSYTTNIIKLISFFHSECQEYELDGRRYVRVYANTYNPREILSNGQVYAKGQGVWLEVKPIKWWVDEKTDVMVTEKIIAAGIHLNKALDSMVNYEESEMKLFLENNLSKEIMQDNNFYNKVEDEKTLCKKKYK